MSLETAIARFRRRQADLFRDTARIERPSGTTTLDPNTGQETPDPPTLIYEGACALRGMRWDGTDVEAGGGEVRIKGSRIHFPTDTAVLHKDLVTFTGSIYDPSLVGRTFVVIDVPPEGWQISRWVLVEEVT